MSHIPVWVHMAWGKQRCLIWMSLLPLSFSAIYFDSRPPAYLAGKHRIRHGRITVCFFVSFDSATLVNTKNRSLRKMRCCIRPGKHVHRVAPGAREGQSQANNSSLSWIDEHPSMECWRLFSCRICDNFILWASLGLFLPVLIEDHVFLILQSLTKTGMVYFEARFRSFPLRMML